MTDNKEILYGVFYPSENPGAHERHLIRRHKNVLFGERATEVTSDSLQHHSIADVDRLEKENEEITKAAQNYVFMEGYQKYLGLAETKKSSN